MGSLKITQLTGKLDLPSFAFIFLISFLILYCNVHKITNLFSDFFVYKKFNKIGRVT